MAIKYDDKGWILEAKLLFVRVKKKNLKPPKWLTISASLKMKEITPGFAPLPPSLRLLYVPASQTELVIFQF